MDWVRYVRLLVIEDEFKLGEYLKKGLDENGYTTELARNGLDGQFRALQGDHDLVVLDVGLPGIDGFSILKSLRQCRKTPVLMLTARDRVEDRVRGLHEGADDYLVKPFAFPELLARVRALLRRSGHAQAETGLPKIADLELDLVRRRAFRGRQQLLLTSKEFALLALLVRRNGEILARTTIAEQVWEMNFDSDTNYVEVAVRRLRAKLDDPFTHKLLHTVRGMGYVLEDRS